jgi:hypothetical protein
LRRFLSFFLNLAHLVDFFPLLSYPLDFPDYLQHHFLLIFLVVFLPPDFLDYLQHLPLVQQVMKVQDSLLVAQDSPLLMHQGSQAHLSTKLMNQSALLPHFHPPSVLKNHHPYYSFSPPFDSFLLSI